MTNLYSYSKAKPYLRLRSEPNTECEILDSIYPYTVIHLLNETYENWSKVSYNDKIGYVNKNYLANIHEQYLCNYAIENNIDFHLLLAILMVESRNKGFRPDGELTLRFELHLFKKYYCTDNHRKYLFIKNFNLYKQLHYVYINGTPIEYHQNNLELEALNIAKTLDEYCALISTSWGIPQIMGFNHRLVGFNRVNDMLLFMKESELNQYKIFINFLNACNIIQYINSYDFNKIAELYNGIGNVNVYSQLIKTQYETIKYGTN